MATTATFSGVRISSICTNRSSSASFAQPSVSVNSLPKPRRNVVRSLKLKSSEVLLRNRISDRVGGKSSSSRSFVVRCDASSNGRLLTEEKHAKHKRILEQYQSKAEYYICSCLNKNNGTKNNAGFTPSGLIYIRQWNNMQYVSSGSFLTMVYSDLLHKSNQKKLKCHGGDAIPQELLQFSISQVDYILGSNPMNMSYLVGFGPRFPTRVHHRGASIVSYRENKGFIGCTQGYDNWYGSKDPNPNIVVGALVGGPNHNDEFFDHRGNYMQTEACTYNTAPLVGIFARLNYLQNTVLHTSY